MHYFVTRTISIISMAALLFSCSRPKEAGPDDVVTEISGASAHWVSSDRLIWDSGEFGYRHEIRYSADADIAVNEEGVSGGEVIEVGREVSAGSEIRDRYPHLSDRPVRRVGADKPIIKEALKGQLVAVAYDPNDKPVAATRVQFPGVIDELYFYDGELGPIYDGDNITLKLWAPTAQSVRLNIYDAGEDRLEQLEPVNDQHPEDGVWHFRGDREEWDRKYYRFDISVYHHDNQKVNHYEVTDPYSVSLTTDSRFSQFVNLDDEDLKPNCWGRLKKSLPHPSDITLYEAHVRDFSMEDQTVPEEYRGKYMAFTHNGVGDRPLSEGMAHLRRLSDAGLTHLHLLPVNDIASVIEDTTRRIDLHHPYDRICEFFDHPELNQLCDEHGSRSIREVFGEMAEEDPATELIQKPYSVPGRMEGMAARDGFNWGYDPFHFNVPQGSYATDPDGTARILELRHMVQSLAQIGLNVVVDVVYNHTFASGPESRFSVLDKVVPGYYHRYDVDTGEMETSTCCENTAAEHGMMEKLIIDSVVLWARNYKIDSFRFDLMGHHPKSVMERLKEELAGLTLEDDGVDGENIYIYGEGWNFGEVADDRIFVQATQFNMGGTGIGNFNDRSRDAIRGGNFTDHGRSQGFTSGMYLFPNEDAYSEQEDNLASLLEAGDRIRVGMAGNLSTYPYLNRDGDRVDGGNEMIGFALNPQESVNYIDKHDNETLWDNTQVKLPLDMGMSDRVRVHMLSNAFINYGQGVPFYQMGTDILRSKSLDRNSFDSGDWYNAVDFSLDSHKWGKGLPPAWDNEPRWDQMRDFLRNPVFDVQKELMDLAHQLFREQLRIRYSSPLFRLREAEQVHKRVAFLNTGPEQEPGIIAMAISDGQCAGEPLDPELDGILVIFNADNEYRTISLEREGVSWEGLQLHPIQADGVDPVVKESERDGNNFRIPPHTSAVFVKPQADGQGTFICNE